MRAPVRGRAFALSKESRVMTEKFGYTKSKPVKKPGVIYTRDLPSWGICYGINHLRKMWNAGLFPKPFKLSPRKLAWNEADITAWIESKRAA
jgi:hypothetical protein